MPKRPLRKVGNALVRNQRRKGQPILTYIGASLTFLLLLYAHLVIRATQNHAIEMQGNRPTMNPPQRPESNSVPRRDMVQSEIALTTASKDKGVSQSKNAGDSETTILLVFGEAHCKGGPIATGKASTAEPVDVKPPIFPKSVLVLGKGLAETYVSSQDYYKGTVMEVEGCVDFYNLFQYDHAKFVLYSAANQEKVLTARRQIQPELQKKFATVPDLNKPHTRFVFSATSSRYFGYQVYANALGFLDSKQTEASWTRLLSAGQTDDLSEKFPTFVAPKSLYDNFYQPINKADVIDKWMHSPDAPHPDDTIVVMDTDNWLINDLHAWTKRVSSKNTLGQAAYYKGSPMLQDLWHDICRKNCHIPTDPAAVPYVIKASDLKEVAPLWREYSIDIRERFNDNTTFKEKYGPGLGVRWASEMFGYNSACTHLGIKTTIVSDMQLRDVDGGKRQWNNLRHIMPMIHVGRAWFPKEHPELAAPWRHTESNEPESIQASGIQVWCKCNQTASYIQPWPLPENLDFVSYHTLRLLHDSVKRFGPIPVNETYRKERPILYGDSVP